MSAAPDVPPRPEPASGDLVDAASLLRAALALHQAGRLAEAEQGYRRILGVQPQHFDSLHLLGVIFAQRGDHAAAVHQIDAAIAANPAVAAAHNNRAVSLNVLGRRDDALASFERALALAPDYADALQARAGTLLDLGRFAEAVAACDRAMALRPGVAELPLKRGHALAALNRFADAIDSYDRALALAPGREACIGRALALGRLDRVDEALASYDQAIARDPDAAELHSDRGAMLKRLRRLDEALASCERAIALAPDLAAAHSNRGIVLREQGRYAEALASYDTAIRLRPDFGEAFSNRANVLVTLRRFDDAMADYRRAFAINPGDANARCNCGMIELLIGRFAEGWADYEARWDIHQMASGRPAFAQPQWTGDADIRGKRLLLLPEQGIGDTIMAVRYVPRVIERGATVILQLPASLRALLAPIGGGREIVIEGEPLPDFDLYCPLLSLPRAFGTTLATIPAEVPYVAPPADRAAAWRARLAALPGVRIGLVWAGNPQHVNDTRRSIALRALLPVLAQPGVRFVSLQKELRPGDAELLGVHPQVTHLGDDLASFEDTAAVIALLDLVIAVDTSVAHLVGALGKPVWMLLPASPDWRWLLDREDSPWYPTARLFRQSAPDEWGDVVARVSAESRRLTRDRGINIARTRKPAS